ncbi:hypothetical protein HYU90_03180 [Candidatus Collierbacteria bacterium]|nr:hypothetical protein [Candidatus Collierbacteria bacterium]
MSRFARPLLVAIILMVTAFYLSFPQPAIIGLLAGSLVGYIIGSVKGEGAVYSVLAIGAFSFLAMLWTNPIFSEPLLPAAFTQAGIGWCIGFPTVGIASLISHPPKSTP